MRYLGRRRRSDVIRSLILEHRLTDYEIHAAAVKLDDTALPNNTISHYRNEMSEAVATIRHLPTRRAIEALLEPIPKKEDEPVLHAPRA